MAKQKATRTTFKPKSTVGKSTKRRRPAGGKRGSSNQWAQYVSGGSSAPIPD
jgi:hypothetical protein